MGLININNLEDGVDATANIFNQRFGIIADTINGNLDTQNLADGAVTREKLAPQSVTSDKLLVNKYVDDNGWTVTDFGAIKTYTRQISITNVSIAGNGGRQTLWSGPAPIGRTNTNVVLNATWYGGNAGNLVLGGEPQGGQILVVGGNNFPSAISYTGLMNITVQDA